MIFNETSSKNNCTVGQVRHTVLFKQGSQMNEGKVKGRYLQITANLVPLAV